MWPDSQYAHPVSSYRSPVPVPGINPADDPLVYVGFNRTWLPYIVGSLKQLLLQSTWATDDAATLNLTQEQAFNLLWLFSLAEAGIFLPGIIAGGDDDMGLIRQNPTNPCLLEGTFDGTHWITIMDVSKCQNFGTQPGAGTPQPQPGGGSQQYCNTLQANGIYYVPTVVNTGDLITVSISGAGWDGSETDGVGLPLWRCPDGSEFFAGVCEGATRTSGTDPLPSAAHMTPVINIGGTFYSLANPLTVPGGVVNQPSYIQINANPLNACQGSYNLCVTVQNNQVGSWTHVFDFTVSQQGWTIGTAGGAPTAVYLAGQGFGSVATPIDPTDTLDDIEITFPARTITSIEVLFFTDSDNGSGGSRVVFANYPTVYMSLSTGAGAFDDFHAAVQAAVTGLAVSVDRHDLPVSTNYRITKIVVQGQGTDPF